MFSPKKFLESAMVTFIGVAVVGCLTAPLPPVAAALVVGAVALYCAFDDSPRCRVRRL